MSNLGCPMRVPPARRSALRPPALQFRLAPERGQVHFRHPTTDPARPRQGPALRAARFKVESSATQVVKPGSPSRLAHAGGAAPHARAFQLPRSPRRLGVCRHCRACLESRTLPGLSGKPRAKTRGTMGVGKPDRALRSWRGSAHLAALKQRTRPDEEEGAPVGRAQRGVPCRIKIDAAVAGQIARQQPTLFWRRADP